MFVILLATYNGENYIEEQLKSIVSQSYKDWYLLISDDGSVDSTLGIIEDYVGKYPNQIAVINNSGEKHSAMANFINLIANAPKGDYYAFCDQDDVWCQDKLQLLVEEYQRFGQEPMLIYHDLKVVDEHLNILGESFREYTELCLDLDYPFEDLLKCNYIPGCAISLNYSLMELIKIPGDRASIHDWWVMLVASAFGKIRILDKALVLYRQHSNNTIGIASKGRGFNLLKRYFSPAKMKNVFGSIKSAKIETLNMLQEFVALYGDELNDGMRALCEKNIYYHSCKNKLVSLLWGLKRNNRQKGFVKNIYYWTASIE